MFSVKCFHSSYEYKKANIKRLALLIMGNNNQTGMSRHEKNVYSKQSLVKLTDIRVQSLAYVDSLLYPRINTNTCSGIRLINKHINQSLSYSIYE